MAAPAGPESWPTVLGPDANGKVRFDGKPVWWWTTTPINQMVISELMETFGFTIFTASDGKKALTAAVRASLRHHHDGLPDAEHGWL
jgi:hypothetical protein